MRVLLVSSGGGHLAQIMALRSWWERHERTWWAVDGPDARARLAGEAVQWARGPTNRSASALARNAVAAPAVFRRARPDVVLSAGAALAVPAFYWARAVGCRTVFMELIDRVDRPSLSARLVAPVASEIWVHWPEQLAHHPRARVLGPLWGGP